MRKDRSSITATGIAIVRAVESEKPSDVRICYDPFARKFVSPWMYSLLGLFIKTGYAEMRGPGVNGFLVLRDRYIDDVLQEYLDAGLQQLVILGAGYDSRAYRFELAGRTRTFEVDHPATQSDKLEKLHKVFGKIPEHVTYVSIDFNTQSLSERLTESGYDPMLKTLFIWQGVTMYLTSPAVDETLQFIVKNSAPGSAVVFDYLHQAVLDGIKRQSEIKSMHRYRFMTGEGLTFGIPEGTAGTFLQNRDFREVNDMSTQQLKTIYFTGKNADRKAVSGYGIVIGKV